MTRSRIAIIIPTRNAGPDLDRVLSAIVTQTGRYEPEIIAIDSGSTDGTVERLQRAGARVLGVAPGQFNHGTTRNDALRHAGGDYAVLLVQDAVPVSTAWLTALVQPLLDDHSIAGTFARQVPHARASRVTAHYLSQWVAAQPSGTDGGPVDHRSLRSNVSSGSSRRLRVR